MPSQDDFRWFKKTFSDEIATAISGTPFSVDMLAAIAAQETGDVWESLREKLSVPDLLAVCVGDTLDADKGRRAFPQNKADLFAWPRGDEMFQVARAALETLALHLPGYAQVAKMPDKFCHAFGIFQYDIQFFKTDPNYFLDAQWSQFGGSLTKCLQELRAAMQRMGMADQESLTDLEKVHVAIAYNCGKFDPAKGLKQGYFDGRKYYGEYIFDYLQLSQSSSIGSTSGAVAAVGGAAVHTAGS